MSPSDWRLYGRRLVESEMIAPTGYGKGLPVYLPWGLRIASRMAEVFQEELCASDALIRRPEMLIQENEFDLEVADLGSYDSVYRIQVEGRPRIVRPDAAVENLATLGNKVGAVLSVYQGFRRVRGATPPLFRDRCIQPFIQLNRIVSRDDAPQWTRRIVSGLTRFFERLCLPVRVARVGRWKNYAADLFDVVLTLPGGRPTILAMAYVVGDPYRRAAGIGPDMVAFDVGITEKTLGALVLCRPQNEAMALPSSVSPVSVVVGAAKCEATDGGVAPRLAHDLRGGGSTSLLVVDVHSRHWWKAWARRGVPVIIEARGEGRTRRKLAGGPWERLRRGTDLESLLAEADRKVRRDFDRTTGAGASTDAFRFLCEHCMPPSGLRGTVVPEESGACASCGLSGLLRFCVQAEQIY